MVRNAGILGIVSEVRISLFQDVGFREDLQRNDPT